MVKLFEDKMGGREAEVVLDDPRSGAGIVSWFNGTRSLPFYFYIGFVEFDVQISIFRISMRKGAKNRSSHLL